MLVLFGLLALLVAALAIWYHRWSYYAPVVPEVPIITTKLPFIHAGLQLFAEPKIFLQEAIKKVGGINRPLQLTSARQIFHRGSIWNSLFLCI